MGNISNCCFNKKKSDVDEQDMLNQKRDNFVFDMSHFKNKTTFISFSLSFYYFSFGRTFGLPLDSFGLCRFSSSFFGEAQFGII